MPPKPMAKIKKLPPFYNLKFSDGCSFHFKTTSHVNIHKFKAKHRVAQALGKQIGITIHNTDLLFCTVRFLYKKCDAHFPFTH